jgi:Winged helix DNA-binding domain
MPAAERTLTQRELNRALLARQQLLERDNTTIPRMLERMAGLQAQYAPSMYIGLWSRLEGFERDDLDRVLERRRVVQGTLMRMTIHLVSARDYWPFATAIRHTRREWWLKSHKDGPSAREMADAAKRLRRRLREGALRRSDVDAIVGGGAVGVGGVGVWLDLVRVPPSGTWDRRRADVYAAAEDWLGAPPAIGTDDAREQLVRRYLGGFGPASRTDIADWAGLPVKDVTSVLARMRVRRFRDESGTELVDLPRAPIPDPDTPAPVRFLPVWDAVLLAHARTTGILPEEHRSKVFSTRTPQSVATFLVDGTVSGTWTYAKGRIRLEPFGRLDQSTRRQLEEEAEGLAALHA